MFGTPAMGWDEPSTLRNHSTVGSGMEVSSQEKDAVSSPGTNGPRLCGLEGLVMVTGAEGRGGGRKREREGRREITTKYSLHVYYPTTRTIDHHR